MASTPPTDQSLDGARLQLERERLDLDREKMAIDNRFATKHLGVLLTALVSVAATLVSAGQVWKSSIDHHSEVERANIQKDKEIAVAQLEQDRRYKLDVAIFLFDRRDKLLSSNPSENATTRDLLLVTFPPEITEPIFRRLQATTSQPAQQQIWAQAAQTAERLARPRVFVHYTRGVEQAVAAQVADDLVKAGFQVPPIEQVDIARSSSEVRYFHSEDHDAAAAIAIQVGSSLGRPAVGLMKIASLGGAARQGTIEVWIANAQ